MALTTYPLNDSNYAAEDAELFHCSRCSGIYANEDFPCSVTGADTTVTIGIGLAWIRNSRFSGKVAALKEAVAKDLGTADSTYPRIDVIALRFDANSNKTDVVVKQGTPSSSPIMPAISRTEVLYELYLYAVRREAGAVSVTAADITDLRLDSNYCGLMADSVSRINLDTIRAQLKSEIDKLHAQTDIAKKTIVGAQMEPLWRNGDTTVNYDAQELPLGVDINDYYKFIVGFQYSTSVYNSNPTTLELFDIPNDPELRYTMTLQMRASNRYAERSVRINADNNSLVFGRCTHYYENVVPAGGSYIVSATPVLSDRYMIPVVVYGVKGVPGDEGYDVAAIQNIVDEYLAQNPPVTEEADPTVPEWAKKPEKPTYTAEEVGALPADSLQQAAEEVLAQAKAGGQFDGKSAYDYAEEAGYIGTEEAFGKKLVGVASVLDYGAVGDGVTDDSDAFIAALENKQSVVFVPGGTYRLSKTIVITENSCLELSQNTLLDFTQTSGNCIEMRGSATLRGNHGNINVSGDFTGNVISVDTGLDGVVHASIPPYAASTPLWKRQRFIYDVNITRTEGNFQASLTGGHSGTALYISANYDTTEAYDGVNTAPITCIWAMSVSGLRIGGAFDYGINIENRDKTESGYGNAYDPSWNHDMRIEAVIVGCETGVRVFNCNTAHLDVTIEPALSIYSVDGAQVKYAKNGIILEHSNHIDLSQSLVWDWNSSSTLLDQDAKNAHIALIGTCKGVILSDFLYHEHSSTDIRDLIYTDTTSNFDSLIILQEPFTRWFKPVDNKPYFFDGEKDRLLAYRDEIDEFFQTDRVAGYTDALANAIDSDGTIYNEIGYSRSGGTINGAGAVNTGQAGYYGHTGFIAIQQGSTLHVEGLKLTDDGDVRVVAYDSSFAMVATQNAGNIIGGGSYTFPYTETENGFDMTITNRPDCAYIRIGFLTKDLADNPAMAVDEEIKFVQKGFLADGIKVKGDAVVLTSPGGKAYSLSVSDDGVLTAVEMEMS